MLRIRSLLYLLRLKRWYHALGNIYRMLLNCSRLYPCQRLVPSRSIYSMAEDNLLNCLFVMYSTILIYDLILGHIRSMSSYIQFSEVYG